MKTAPSPIAKQLQQLCPFALPEPYAGTKPPAKGPPSPKANEHSRTRLMHSLDPFSRHTLKLSLRRCAGTSHATDAPATHSPERTLHTLHDHKRPCPVL